MKKADLILPLLLALFLPAPALAREEAPPDPELLEFLGSFETSRGKPVDPFAFSEYPGQEIKNKPREQAKPDGKRRRTPEKQQPKDGSDEK